MTMYISKDDKIVIGIDLSLNNTGFSCVGLCCKNIQPDKGKNSLYSSGKLIISAINNVLKKSGDRIDLVVLEDYSYGIRGAGLITKIAELTGVLKYYLTKKNIKLLTVAPTQLKKYITGSGRGNKDTVMKMAYKKWKIDKKTTHETEAIVLCMIGKRVLKFKTIKKKDCKKYEYEVLKKLYDKMIGGE